MTEDDRLKKRLLTLEEQIARVDLGLLDILKVSVAGASQGKCNCASCACDKDLPSEVRSSKVGDVQAVRDC